MNRAVSNELEKIRYPLQYDDTTTHLIIPKKEDVFAPSNVVLTVGSCYLIKLSPSIMNDTGDSVLASNWNKGVVPKTPLMNVNVNKFANNLVNVDGVGVQPDGELLTGDVYTDLWLPTTGIQVVKEL